MKTVAILGGRFQPPHLGHLDNYNNLVNQFGKNSVYIATSKKQAPITSPFSFENKVKLWELLGVPSDKIVEVVCPYKPKEIIKHIPSPNNTILVLSIADKDMETDKPRFIFNNTSYLQEYGDNLHTLDKHAYVLTMPTKKFHIGGIPFTSAREIREHYLSANDVGRTKILKELYGKATPNIKKMFDESFTLVEHTLYLLKEYRRINSRKISLLVESILTMESKVKPSNYSFKRSIL